jgi:protein gp37
MAPTTGIAWTDNTFNPLLACTAVGPRCEHCYARAFGERVRQANWGAQLLRVWRLKVGR